MENVSQIEQSLKQIVEERANVLARETGCIERQRKFSGADLVQTLVFGWLSHPDASLEMLASTAAIREVYVSDTAVHNRFNESCARFLHAVLEEMVSVLVHAEQPVPLELLHRFSSVVLEDSSSITLPKELADCWQGSGGGLGGGEAAIKLHVRWDLTHGQLFGPRLTDGRVSDQCSPFRQMSLSAGSLYIADLGYFESLCSHGTRDVLAATPSREPEATPRSSPSKANACACRVFYPNAWGKPKRCMYSLAMSNGIGCDS